MRSRGSNTHPQFVAYPEHSPIFGTGQMADLTRAMDWSKTSLGPVDLWPPALVTIVNVLLESCHPMFLWWDNDLIQFYNDAYSKILGSDKHPSALGQRGADCWTEIWPLIFPQIQTVMQHGKSIWSEDQLIPIFRNGKLDDIYWTYSYSPVRDDLGAIRGTLVTCSDTTGRVLAERQLEQVLDVTTDGVIALDREWNVTYLNARAEAILAPSGQLAGKNFWRVFPDAVYQGSPFVEHYTRAMEHDVPADFEAFYPEPLNRWFQALVRPTAAGIIIFFRDITEQRLATAALMQSEKLAAVGRLASSIAHEINNPLESVTNLLYLARNSDEETETRSYLDLAERELRRVSAIANQTLRFHKQSSSPTSVHPEDLFDSVTLIYQGKLSNHQIEVTRSKRGNRPVLCFEGEIRQVLSNLVGNAIDAISPNPGRLQLRCREATDTRTGKQGIVFTVADSGPGMSPQTAARALEPFYTTKDIGGTGLGLWISQEIVGRHHGHMRFRSSQHPDHHGTVFTIFLPFPASPR
ncbi:MAG: PAS domain-containing protein [Acidobacteriota bacterium]|nr:PAS domain-containing protein [Acidobacteriota bacterium]